MTNIDIERYRADPGRLDATSGSGIVTVGLVPSPGQCDRVVADIGDTLPAVLAENIDDDVAWEIRVVSDPLTGSNVETPRLLEEIEQAWGDDR